MDAHASFRLGKWLVRPDVRVISDGSRNRALDPRTMAMLVYLAENHGSVVSADELILELWSGRFVGDNPIYKHVALLRKALGDSAKKPMYVDTIPKRGYRLVTRPNFLKDSIRNKFETTELWMQGSPYRGLKRFDFEHAAVFFGRSQVIADALRVLRELNELRKKFLLVLGPSGSGKSSFVRAGIAPMLVQPGIVEPVDAWHRSTITPSDESGDLRRSLARALLPRTGSASINGPLFSDLVTVLRESPGDVVKFLRRTVPAFRRNDSRILLIVDQFEEVFTHKNISHDDIDRFCQAIEALSGSGNVWVIMMVRSDYYPQCVEFDSLVRLKSGVGQFDLRAPSSAEISQMIRQPACAARLSFEENPDSGQRLDDLLRDAAIHQPSALPMLEFTLEELYKRRTDDGVLTFEAYQGLGGLEGALSTRAEQSFLSLSDDLRRLFPNVLHQLVRVDPLDGKLSRRHVEWQLTDDETRKVLDTFVVARLFVSELIELDRRVVSVAHEALLAHWNRVTEWVADNNHALRTHSRLTRAAGRWKAEGNSRDLLLPIGRRLDEMTTLVRESNLQITAVEAGYITASTARAKRRRSMRNAGIISLAVLSVVAGIAAYVATGAQTDAERRKEQVDDLMGFMLGDLRSKLAPLGRLDILDDVGDKALSYYQSLAPADLGRVTLINHSKALRQIGDVRLAQGKLAIANNAFTSALALSSEVSRRDPTDVDALFSVGSAHYWVGFVAWRQGFADRVKEHWQAYFDIAESLTTLDPGNPTWQLELSYAYNNLGTLAKEAGNYNGAISHFQRSTDIKRQILASGGADSGVEMELADSISWIASTLELKGELGNSLTEHQRQLEYLDRLVERDPVDTRWRYRKSIAQQHVARLLEITGNAQGALAQLTAARDSIAGLIIIDNSNMNWKYDAAYVRMKLGHVNSEIENAVAAISHHRAAQAAFSDLVENDPSRISRRRMYAINLVSLAHALVETGEVTEAVKAVESAIKHLEDILEAAEQDDLARRWLAFGLYVEGKAFERNDDQHRATNSWLRAIDTLPVAYLASNDVHVLSTALVTLVALNDYQRVQAITNKLVDLGYRKRAFLIFCEKTARCELS